jgi:hypothetical protein
MRNLSVRSINWFIRKIGKKLQRRRPSLFATGAGWKIRAIQVPVGVESTVFTIETLHIVDEANESSETKD